VRVSIMKASTIVYLSVKIAFPCALDNSRCHAISSH
jgi:hypothetical protein